MKKTSGIAIAFTALMLVCCIKKQVNSDISLLGLDYYPTTAGKYIVYDVDSVVYTQLPKDTLEFKYRIKEKMAGTFTDNTGKSALRIERYIKKFNPKLSYDSIPWTIKEVWMANADNRAVQVVESNYRYTKLIFPVEEKATWNGNASNTLGEWQYVYEYIDRSEIINNTAFDKVLLVRQKLFDPKISYQNYFEKYAKGVGLVYREIDDVKSNAISTLPVLNRIESGLVYKQTFVTTGYE